MFSFHSSLSHGFHIIVFKGLFIFHLFLFFISSLKCGLWTKNNCHLLQKCQFFNGFFVLNIVVCINFLNLIRNFFWSSIFHFKNPSNYLLTSFNCTISIKTDDSYFGLQEFLLRQQILLI